MDTTNGAVAALAAQLVADQQDRDALLNAWLNGTSDGGPNGDGKYPLPSPTGEVLVPCWASITDPVTGAAADALQSSEGAEQDRLAAAQIKSDIETIKAAIDLLLTEARSLRDEAQARANDAAAEHAAARSERETCQAIQTNIQALYDEWASS